MLQEILKTENIIQGGGISIALYLSWIIYKLTSNHERHFIQAMKENSDNTKENTRVLTELKDIILQIKK